MAETIDLIQIDLSSILQQTTELTKSITSLEEANKSLRKDIKKTDDQLKEEGKTREQLNLELADNTESLRSLKKEQSDNIKLIKSEVNSIDQLKQRNKQLTTERNNLNLKTKEGQARLKEINKELDSNNKIIKNNSSALEKQKINVGNYGSALSALPGPMGSFVTGIGNMTKAALKFIATPIGAVIAAVVLALGALKAAFTSSEEGQNKFAKIMAVINTILGNLMDVAADVGEALISAAEKPKEAWQGFKDFIKGIGDFFKNTFGNIIGGSIEVFTGQMQKSFAQIGVGWQKLKGIFTENTKGINEAQEKIDEYNQKIAEGQERVSQGAESLKESVVNAYNNMKEGVEGFIEQNIKEAALAMRVADMRARADKIERKLITERADLEAKIAELRLKAREEDSYSADERKKFLIEARDLQDGLLSKEKEVLILRAEAIKLENTFSRTNKENLTKEAEAIAAISRKETERYNQARQLQRELNTINNELERAIKAKEAADAKANQKALEGISELSRKRLESETTTLDELMKLRLAWAEEDYNNTLMQKELLDSEKVLLEMQYQDQVKAINDDYAAKQLAEDKKQAQERARIFREGLQLSTDATNAFFANAQTVRDVNYENEIKAAGENQTKQDNIKKKFAAKQKKADIAAAGANTALSITKAYSQLGPIAGTIATAILIATLGTQISKIRNTNYYKKGGEVKLASGGEVKSGVFKGASHSGGGIDLYTGSGQHVANVEGNEGFYVVNKIDNKRAINALSDINSRHGKSFSTPVRFAQEGGEIAANSGFNAQQLAEMLSKMNIFVKVVDINNAQATYAKVVSTGEI